MAATVGLGGFSIVSRSAGLELEIKDLLCEHHRHGNVDLCSHRLLDHGLEQNEVERSDAQVEDGRINADLLSRHLEQLSQSALNLLLRRGLRLSPPGLA